ncbi:hypothetical protein [Novosphingobium colocasiae]|uniref:DUF6976 family protein n=1 Tax=Novosphingobium colocasiae TaxID=1256513 RepID=UPI0035B081D5
MNSPSSPASKGAIINGLMPVDAVAGLIRAGACLTVAGRKAALDRLPAGQWIGGTSPYFMTLDGGRVVSDDEVFVTDLGAYGDVTIAAVDVHELERISGDAPDHGISIAIIPAGSPCHEAFARNAGTYPDAFLKPAVGWIAGTIWPSRHRPRASTMAAPHWRCTTAPSSHTSRCR